MKALQPRTPSLSAPPAEAAARAAVSSRARRRVGSPPGSAPCPAQAARGPGELLHLGSMAASLLFLPTGGHTSAAAAALLASGTGLHSCGRRRRAGCPSQAPAPWAACLPAPQSRRASAAPRCQALLSPARGFDRKLKINVPRSTCAGSTHGAEDVPSMATGASRSGAGVPRASGQGAGRLRGQQG